MADRDPLITYQMVYSLPCEKVAPVIEPDEQEIALEKDIALEDNAKVEVVLEDSAKAENEDGSDKEASVTPVVKPPAGCFWNKPCLMIVFGNGDFNSALHYLINSLHSPFEKYSVASILIEECLVENFVDRLRSQLVELKPQVATHPNYLHSLKKIDQLKPQMVSNPQLQASPILIYDIPQSFLGKETTGIITMHPFRTPIDAIEMSIKEALPFAFVSIWNERVADTYHVIADLKIDTIMINCCDMNLEIIRRAFAAKRSDVHVFKGYHYETLVLNGKQKIIVFPIGTIFGN